MYTVCHLTCTAMSSMTEHCSYLNFKQLCIELPQVKRQITANVGIAVRYNTQKQN